MQVTPSAKRARSCCCCVMGIEMAIMNSEYGRILFDVDSVNHNE